MDQEANKQWGSLSPLHLLLAPTPVLAAAAPDGPRSPFSFLLCALPLPNGARSRLDQGHGSVINKDQGGKRVAPGRLGPALTS